VLRFGTDGVRGDAESVLTTRAMVALGRAIARALRPDRLLIGRDTRVSGERIEQALALGCTLEGVKPVGLDVLPTPAIAFTAARQGAPAAIVSASHNPWTDNGVKVIGADGRKLDDDAEAAIERELEIALAHEPPVHDLQVAVQNVARASDAYVDHLVGALAGRSLAGLRVVLDCANGAASVVGPRAWERAGAHVHVLNAEPDGRNINADCGSTSPSSLQAAVREHGAALGLALDGDADRVIAVDERGEIVDGDQIMLVTALDLHARGLLARDTVVVTVMSNLGLRRALRDANIDVVETPVGDRSVVAAMYERGATLGGEQSGHIIYAEHATTGDGLLTGLLLADVMQRSGRALSELAGPMERYPQLLENVRVEQRVDLEHADALWQEVRTIEAELGDHGRVLVRASGTEPVVRVMAEAASREAAERAVQRLRSAVEAEFGTRNPT
jgi:phosphoglucosamine mutase